MHTVLSLDSLSLVAFCNCFELLKTVTIKQPHSGNYTILCHLQTTLESEIDAGQGINVGSGKFGKMNKQNVQTYVEKISNFEIFVAHGCRAWKNIQN